MSVRLSSVADAEIDAPLAPPPLAAVDRLENVTVASGAARSVELDSRALLVYVCFGVLTLADDGRRAARALPGELVLVDGQQQFGYANASKAEELMVLEVALAGQSDSARVAQRYFSDDEKSTKLCRIASADGRGGSLRLARDLDVSLTRLARWETVLSDMAAPRIALAVVLSGEATVNNETVKQGGSACVSDTDELRISGVTGAEVMIIEGAARDGADRVTNIGKQD